MDPSRVVIVVQARMSSSRLPGKVLLPLCGAPAIVRLVERVRRVGRAARCLLATSRHESDDALVKACEDNGIDVSRGDLEDVLGRVAHAVPSDCETVVRLTGDCPLVDPAVVDRHLEVFAAQAPDAYVSNALQRTFPDGLDVEVMSRALLIDAARHATAASDREHVTPWIQRHARHVPVVQDVDLSPVRWVLDTAADYRVIADIYDALHPGRPAFGSGDVYRLQIERRSLIRLAGDLTMQEVMARMKRHVALEVES